MKSIFTTMTFDNSVSKQVNTLYIYYNNNSILSTICSGDSNFSDIKKTSAFLNMFDSNPVELNNEYFDLTVSKKIENNEDATIIARDIAKSIIQVCYLNSQQANFNEVSFGFGDVRFVQKSFSEEFSEKFHSLLSELVSESAEKAPSDYFYVMVGLLIYSNEACNHFI